MDAFTGSWLSAKFSRFHLSQQCDERNAVELLNDSIAKRFALGNPFTQIICRTGLIIACHSLQQLYASYREKSHVLTSAIPVPM